MCSFVFFCGQAFFASSERSLVKFLRLFSRVRGPAVQANEPPQQREERNQRQGEEQRPAVVMDRRMDHLRPDVDAQLPDYEDPKAVP